MSNHSRPEVGLFLDLPTDSASVGERLAAYLPLLPLAEAAGFSSVWAGESYPGPEGGIQHVPSPLIVLAALSQHTRMALGTAVTLLPVWEPLRLAYDTIVLDQLCGGRLTIGIGLGNAKTWKLFGIDPETVGQRTEEMILALRALWAGEPGFTGEIIQANGPIGPAPLQPGGPRILIGGKIGRSAERAARLGDGYLAGTHFRQDMIRHQIERYRAALGGHPSKTFTVSVNRLIAVAEDPDEAWTQAGPFIGRLVNRYAKMKMIPGLDPVADDQLEDRRVLERLTAGICLIGSPETVAQEFDSYLADGATQFQFRPAPPGLPLAVAERTIRLIGEQILPRYR